MTDFVHLHVHSEYSLLDGACRIKELVSRAKEMGQKAAAITDHGVMYGAVDFYKECRAQGIKPIIGCEVYVAPRTRFDKEHAFDSNYNHLILLCENDEGYHNLMKLVSAGFTEGFYIKPRVDEELLRKYSAGLICLSGCIAGEVPQKLFYGDYAGAKAAALKHLEIFGEGNYFLEVQDHDMEEEHRVLPLMKQLSQETGIQLAATNDAHYITKDDALLQRVLMCVQMNRTLDDPEKYGFPTEEFYLKNGDEMAERFSDFEGALENTVKIADRCSVELEFGVTKLPYFVPENNETPYDCLCRLCFEGMKKRYGDNPPKEITDRLDYEIKTIDKMGYVEYYLIVHDFINYAKNHDIPVGPGRGSGAGSLVAYCIGITGIDPIKYGLIFERFLNPERISMPDFDVDFCVEKRGRVIDYISSKYGENHVAQIITFGTMAARAAIRDVGRVLGIPYSDVDRISKMIPFMTDLKTALARNKELREKYEEGGSIKQLIDLALTLKSHDVKIIALTSMDYSSNVESAHPSGKKLYEIADLVIDNCAPLGDAMMDIEGIPVKFAPASGLGGDLVLLNAGLHQTAHQLGLEKGIGVLALEVLDERHAPRGRLVHALQDVARHALEPRQLRRHEPPVARDQRRVVVLVEHRDERLYHAQRLDAPHEVGHALGRNLPPRVPRRDLQQVDRYLPTLALVLRRLRCDRFRARLLRLLLGRSLGLRFLLHWFTFRLPIPPTFSGKC